MPRRAALGYAALWQAALALREQGEPYARIRDLLEADIGRALSVRCVYRLVEYGRERRAAREFILILSGSEAATADAAARVRGCRARDLLARTVRLLLADPALLDAVVDDGLRTPEDEPP